MTLDITDTITANSDQVNADDLIGSPVIARITNVERGTGEQPIFIHTDAFAKRTYRPSKSMRRVLAIVWGLEASAWIGRSLELFRNPDISFGKEKVGGIQISRMSHIDKPQTVSLTVSRGKRAPFTVQPLTTIDDAAGWLQAASTLPELQKAWGAVQQAGHAAQLAGLKDARKQELQGGTE